MARKPKVEAEADDGKAKGSAADKKLLLELRERYKKCVEADRDNRKKYRENMRFTLVPGEQWDETSKKERGKDRVMYEFNETRIKCKAVVNQIRSNRPSAKITPAEGGDVELAEAMKGLIDQIQNASDADSVMDYATEHQVIGGMGAERYVTRYCDDSVDRQEIVIEPVKNPMCLYADYACQKQDKSDARFWILASKLAKEVYKATYPNAVAVEFDVDDGFEDDCDEDHVWVAEYWVKKPVTRMLALLSDGKTVDMATIQGLPEGVTVIKSRQVKGHEICQYVCSGDAVIASEEIDADGKPKLVKEHPWAGKEFPFNVVYGEYAVVDGKEVWYGLPEHGKDAQRAHNWAATSVYEAIASTPQGTTWVTEVQAKDLLKEWAESQRKNIRIKRYNFDARSPGPPVSEPPASVPTALVAAMQMSSDSLKAVLGMPDATLGEKGAENSGIAIRRRQEAGAVANYNFGDNMTKFARRRNEILLDLIPKVIDTKRQIRVLGKDGAEKWITVNDIDPVTGERINDLSAGKFDLVVTQGPNYATQRQEAAETYMGLAANDEMLMVSSGDLVYKAMDLPFAQEIAERRRAMLPPQIAQMIGGEGQQSPEVVAAMEQVKLLQAQLQEQAALVEQASADAQKEKSAADKAKSDVEIKIAELATKQAELATDVANFEKLVAQTQAKAAERSQSDNEAKSDEQVAGERAEMEELAAGIGQGLAILQQQFAEQTQALAALMQQIAAQAQVKKPLSAKTVRVNNEFITQMSDGRTARSKRLPGGGFDTQLDVPETVQ
jgi:hypothetical protein